MGSGASQHQETSHINRKYVTKSVHCQTEPWQEQETKSGAAVTVTPAQNDAAKLEDIWVNVGKTLDIPMGEHNKNDLVVKRRGWKTIRIFVSSTFKDLSYEREKLVKEVFPDLRTWCEARRLHLVECDLRWGIPKDTTTEMTLRTCLGEIDRCYQDNVMPYFLNMTSERIGWIPQEGEVPQSLVDEYRWVFGLSITEMEIMHGAYRKDNPNSLFLVRDDSFLQNMPEKHKALFVDENKLAPAKLQTLRKMIRNRFPMERVVNYGCKYTESEKQIIEIDQIFHDKIFDFFKQRIGEQYPLQEEEEEDVFVRALEAHESFMKSRSFSVIGRGKILSQVADYINGSGQEIPLLILGEAGTGKSSLMSKAADETVARAEDNEIRGGGSKGWHVYYHFVGAVPGSTDLMTALARLLREIKVVDESNTPTNLNETVQVVSSALNNPNTRPLIIFVDALNQFDAERQAEQMIWVPKKLSPNVRCIFSMIQDTPQHKSLKAREIKPKEIVVKPLDLAIRKDMVVDYLAKFNKRLDVDQIVSLLSKESSENPLWLSIACEELRVYGEFRILLDQINSLPDGLLELLQQVLTRFEHDGGGKLLVGTLCLLEVSATGLLESELLEILADEDNLMPPEKAGEKGSKESSGKNTFKPCGNLPAFKWASIYRSLRPFLRPFGDSGEGRLDFYHRSLSKAVRKKYLKVTDATDAWNSQYEWWHRKLANFFDHSDNWERKVEEYPVHLIKLKDSKRLAEFLAEWRVFDILYDREFSQTFFRYWKECGGNLVMMELYKKKLQQIATSVEMSPRLIQFGKILNQAGLYKEAQFIAEKAVDMEEEELGKRPVVLVEAYTLLVSILDQLAKGDGYCDPSQVPMDTSNMKLHKKIIHLLNSHDEFKTRYYKVWLGRQHRKLAFTYLHISDCGGSDEYPIDKCIVEGNKHADISLQIFTELHDVGNKAETLQTKAVLCVNDRPLQIKLFQESLDLSIQVYGEYHPATARVYMNTGSVYDEMEDYEKAFENYLHNYIIKKEVYGPDHARTQRGRNILREPIFLQLARQQGRCIIDDEDNQEENLQALPLFTTAGNEN